MKPSALPAKLAAHILVVVLSVVLVACGGRPAEESFDLELDPPTLTLAPGEADAVEVNIGTVGGFNGPVTVTVDGLPVGVAGDEVVAAAGSSISLTIRALENAEPGSYRITVRGASGDLGDEVTLELTIRGGSPPAEVPDAEPFRVLTFSKTLLYRNEVTEAAAEAVRALGEANGFMVDHSEDAAVFNDETLARYDAVVFLMPAGEVLNRSQQQAFERYIQGGGGFAGVHSASIVAWNDPDDYWPWYEGLVGAYFSDHSDVQPHVVVVEDRTHPSTAHLPERWERFDEIYNFRSNPRDNPNITVLLSIDVGSVAGNAPGSNYRATTMGDDHPIAWYQAYDGGRSWYSSGGDTFASWQSDEAFLQHILGGIRYAAGR